MDEKSQDLIYSAMENAKAGHLDLSLHLINWANEMSAVPKAEYENLMKRAKDLASKAPKYEIKDSNTNFKVLDVESDSKNLKEVLDNSDSVTFVGEKNRLRYYDINGVVQVRGYSNSQKYATIVDKKTGKDICNITTNFNMDFLPRDGKEIIFRGILYPNESIIIPHIKK